jgi:DMSO reductase family type II enzyme heme b subunit
MQANLRRQVEMCGRMLRLATLLTVSIVLGALIGCSPSQKAVDTKSQAKQAAAATAQREASGQTNQQVSPQSKPVLLSGKELYLQHCAACHGDQGNGQGLAARFLFPKPRDFGRGQFRLVSTKNFVPSREDLRTVLLRGMPGSAMPPWSHLAPQEIDRLIDEVLRLYQEGLKATIVAELKEADEEIVEAEVAEQVRERTTPDEVLEIPQIVAGDAAAIARGRDIYTTQGCHQCHGKEGRGDGQQVMVDNEGLPTRPRDLTAGIFKGEPDPASIYRRIALGMPGTPMPSSNLKPDQMIDLAHFIRSLSDEDKRNAAILKRERLIATYIPEVSDQGDSGVWSEVRATHVRTAPLWWRDNADSDLRVQAVHDGKQVAFRLSWRDATPDRHSARTEAFKDLAAIELYRGPAEPFLGMGAAAHAVDLWVWDADREAALASNDEQYPDAVTDVYPFTEAAVESAEFTRPSARLAMQDALALPAKAVGNQVAPAARSSAGSSLSAAGPGSVTFRIPENQAVTARGEWRDGRWIVLLSRELKADEAAGIALSPGDKLSVAFAIWDGSHRDRNGQKLVSIWQDLELESDDVKP